MSPRTGAAVVALLLTAAFVVLAHEAAERDLLDVDHTVHGLAQSWRSSALDAPMRALSALGSGTVLIPLNAVLAFVLWRRRYRNPWLIPALTLGSVVIEGLTKWLVHRPRPKAVGYGFPSGHVMGAIVFFGLVLYLLWRARHGDAVACIATAVGIVVVAGIGVSRIYLNSHWLSDVLGAAAAGLAFLIFSVLRLGPRLDARHTEYDDGPPLGGSHPPRIRVEWLVATGVIVLAIVYVGTRTFATNDEARFPVLAQYLLGGGNWLVPSLNGVPYLNKPPLLAWLIAVASWPVGHVTQLTAVVPSVLAGLLTVFMVYRLGRELWNATTGVYAAAIAATTQGLFLHARLAMPDMLMTAFAAVSFWALNRMRRRPEGQAWIAFYVAVAAGFWTKGPAGLMPLAIAVGYALVRRRVQPVAWLRLGPGLLALALLLAPWLLFAAVREGGATQRTLIVDYLLWYIPQHPSIVSLLTPLQHVLSIVFPWAWLIPLALYDAWRHQRGRGAERDAVVLILVWTAAVFALVALSQQQRIRYYVPLVPPLSLLLGWWLAAAVVHWRTLTVWPLRWTAALFGAVGAVALLWSATQGRFWPEIVATTPTSKWQALLIIGAAATVVVGMEIGLRYRRVRRLFPVVAVAAAVLVSTLHHAEESRRNVDADFVRFARLVDGARQAHEPVAALGLPVLPVAFYLGERVTELRPGVDPRTGWTAALNGAAIVVADEALLRERSATVDIAARASLGHRDIVITRIGEGPEVATAPVPSGGRRLARAAAAPSSTPRHLALEVMCLLMAVAGIFARTYLLRHGAPQVAVYVTETIAILALASFPGHWAIFAAGVVACVMCGYLRWHRAALVGRPHELVGLLLVLALPLDVLDDVLRGTAIKADPVWLFTAIAGVALISWTHLRRATA